MSALSLWVFILVALGISKLLQVIWELIDIFILQRRWPISAGSYSSSLFDDPPPPYTEVCQSPTLHGASPCTESPYTQARQSPIFHDVSRVQRLQSFIAWRLAIEYHLESRSINRDREQEYFLRLCKKYCMLLGMQFKSSKEVATAKEQLTRDVFEPAQMLGIPADVMEAFLFFTRFFVHADGPSMSLDISVITYPQAVALRMAIDYTVVIDAAVAGTNPSLASKLKKKCFASHQRHFPWYLDLQTISREYYRQQEEQNEESSTARMSKTPTAAKNNRSSIKKLFYRIAAASHKNIMAYRKRNEFPGLDDDSYSEDSYSGYSDSDLADTLPSTIDEPSIHLKYRKHSLWPAVATLAHQSWRPCIALADLKDSQGLRVSRWDLSTWYDKPKPTSFQPRCVKVKTRGFSCGLPNKVLIAGMQWTNPDGGAPKMQYTDDDGDDLDQIDGTEDWRY